MASGKGIAYAGLILGLIGAGLGGYVFFDYTIAPMLGLTENPTEVTEVNSYYAEKYSATLSSTGSYLPLPEVKVSFETTKTVSLHILYTSYVRIITSLGSSVFINIRLNSTTITDDYYIEKLNVAPQERFAVNMQSYNAALPAGSYNVTVWAIVDATSTIFYMNSLYVQLNT